MSARVPRRRTTLFTGSARTEPVVAALTAGRRAAAVVDARLVDRADRLAGVDLVLPVDADAVDAATVALLSKRLRAHRSDVIVVIGGGTAMDAAAVAAVGVTAPRTLEWALDRAAHSAVVALPADAVPGLDVVAVPTTLGTSAECNAVAIVRATGGASLLLGEALRPRYAILDDVHYRTLAALDVRSACLEAVLRLAGASTAARSHRRAHAHAVALGRALISLGDGALTDAVRLRIARCNAATQRSAALRGRAPFSPRHWYLAHEVSFVARTTKMRATAAIIGRVWQCIEEGDARWGDAGPLETFWREAAHDAPLPLTPAAGIDALIARWELPSASMPDADARASMARRAEQRWGGRGPALPGLHAADFRDLLEGARWQR